MTMNTRQIQAGWNVYGSDDAKVGDVAEVGSNYLLVQKGWLFTRDIYIPLSAVASVQENTIRLNVTKDQVASMGWDSIPVEDATTTYGAGTSGNVADRTVTSTTDRTYTTPTIDRTSSVTTSRSDTGATIDSDVRDADRLHTRAASGDRTTEEMRIPIVEEELRIGKRVIESGGVQVTQRVEERPVNEQVTLRDETVHIERQRVDRPASEADLAAVREGVIEVRDHHEEAVVDKQARIVEEVVIGKQVQEHTETVQDTLHRTNVRVEEIPGETRTTHYTATTRTGASDSAGSGTMTSTDATNAGSTAQDEGALERGLSKAGNAAERATGIDLDRDRDVGQRDPRNNV